MNKLNNFDGDNVDKYGTNLIYVICIVDKSVDMWINTIFSSGGKDEKN